MATNCEKDYYAILGVDGNASYEEIRKAFIRLTKESHPDKFNQDTQRDEWVEANNYQAVLNEAYSVLSDPDKRTIYDQGMLCDDLNLTDNHDVFIKAVSTIQHKKIHCTELPEATIYQLIKLQTTNDSYLYSYNTNNYLTLTMISIATIGWIAIYLSLIAAHHWGIGETIVYSVLTCVSGVGIFHVLRNIYLGALSKIKSNFYITPLYLIWTNHSNVEWYPIWSISDIAATHLNTNGFYTSTDIKFYFGKDSRSITVKPREQLSLIQKALANANRRIQAAYENNDHDYILGNDIFKNYASSADKLTKNNNILYIYAAAVSLFIACIACVTNDRTPLSRDIATNNLYNDTTKSETTTVTSIRNKLYDESGNIIQPKLLPRTGVIRKFSRKRSIAPFTISTRNGNDHYYVKIVECTTNKNVLTLFIRGGEKISTRLPLGEYKLKYATGVEWYGESYHFGTSTSYYLTDKTMKCYITGNQVCGYQIELYPQQNGNLRTVPIDANDW